VIGKRQPKTKPPDVKMGRFSENPHWRTGRRIRLPAVAPAIPLGQTTGSRVLRIRVAMPVRKIGSPCVPVLDWRRGNAPRQHHGRHQQVQQRLWETLRHGGLRNAGATNTTNLVNLGSL
jgi:hypothetical protein